jgi:cytochrome P450
MRTAAVLRQPPLPPDTGPIAALELVRWLRDPCKLMEDCQTRHGDAFTLRIPRRPVVLMSSPEAVKDIFALGPDAAHAGKANALLKPFLGEHSLLLLDGAEHLRQRKMMLPRLPRPADAGVRAHDARHRP